MVLLSCLEYISSSCDNERRAAGGFKGWIMYVVREDDLVEFGVKGLFDHCARRGGGGKRRADACHFDTKNKMEESNFCCAVFQSEAGLIT